MHPEQVASRLEDLCEPGSCGRIAAGDRLGPPCALEEDHRLHGAGIESGAGDSLLDKRPEANGSLGRAGDAARALCKENVAETEGCGPLVGGGP